MRAFVYVCVCVCVRVRVRVRVCEQWTKHITMKEIRRRWGNDETVLTIVAGNRLQWLGHIACMPDHHIPKVLLFEWLSQLRPRSGLEGCDTSRSSVDFIILFLYYINRHVNLIHQ